ncbi:MAG: ribonuclease HII [Ignavibacteriae bacterium]|nr:ribonuclease HII [Ignavibacteriota bacterium]
MTRNKERRTKYKVLSTKYEQQYWNDGILHVAGVDEAGRGPLAGPVVAAAVIVHKNISIDGIDDSKKLNGKKRDELFELIQEKALSVGVGIVSHVLVDEVNILQATFRAMHEAIEQLKPKPQQLLIDGNRFSGKGIPFQTIVDGDAKCFSIAAASIIAKVTRDRLMIEYDEQFPQYGFAQHKGYGTKQHIAAIRKYGLCEIHRKSFHLHDKQLTLFERE